MDYIENFHHDKECKALGKDIEKEFRRLRVYIEIEDWIDADAGRVVYLLKLKQSTREEHIFARAHDVQIRLRLPLFIPFTYKFSICVVASREEIVFSHLPEILTESDYSELSNEVLLPYVVGHDALGALQIVDLCRFPHLLVAGTTNSGKTVGLQSLITSITYSRSPAAVNFILIDVGANDLMPFDGVPHLSCPVVSDKSAACRALVLLKAEMERRMELQVSENSEFEALPRIVLVIDEFPALFVGMEDKQAIKSMTEAVSCLLQRGRHAKIHVVLAAQNPTIQNMRVDLSNITARIAFKCAKRNYSETILGEGSAENLSGQGDMYFKSPQFGELKRIKGSYISAEELQMVLSFIKAKWRDSKYESKFTISRTNLEPTEPEMRSLTKENAQMMKRDTDNELFVRVIAWALNQVSVSCNTLMNEFNIGWSRANRYMERLCDLGIVEELNAKLPRAVLPHSVDDVPAEVVELLVKNGFPIEKGSDTLCGRIGD